MASGHSQSNSLKAEIGNRKKSAKHPKNQILVAFIVRKIPCIVWQLCR